MFFLDCSVGTYGFHELEITASSDGKTDTAATVVVELLPEPNAFVAKAAALTIADILKSADTLSDDIPITVTGTATNVLHKKNVQNFTLYAGEDELPCYYYGTVELTDQRECTVYGVYDEPASCLYVMFIA